jgi:hypothetical protein
LRISAPAASLLTFVTQEPAGVFCFVVFAFVFVFVYVFRLRSPPYVAQVCLELMVSRDSPASASLVLGLQELQPCLEIIHI